MGKYFITSIWFWGFAPIASLFIIFFFLVGLLGLGESLFSIMQWVIPWGLPVIFARFFVLLLIIGVFFYLLTVFFRLILICFDNGFRGLGFSFAAVFFLIRAFFRYYTAGIFIQVVLILLYETLIELISLFYLFYWSIKRRLLKRKRSYFTYKEEDVGFVLYVICRFFFFILSLKFFKKKEPYVYYRRLAGWFCYSYRLKQLKKERKKGYITFAEKRGLCLKYMDTTFNIDKKHAKVIVRNRHYLFTVLEIMDDKEPEIWKEQTKKLL